MKNRWPWRPLQDILYAYLEMITEEKVTIDRSPKSELESSESFPWEIHQHTKRDVHQAVVAFSRLLDAIESRLPLKSTHILLGSSDGIELPYPNWVIESLARKDSLLKNSSQLFLFAISTSTISPQGFGLKI
jgi:hypothetical protein